ncbi:MAG: M6 family metalloprotease domain-containing protein [Candidatus Zixiibacteriota bacterium]
MNNRIKFTRILGALIVLTQLLIVSTMAMPPHPLKEEEARTSGKNIDMIAAKIQEELARGINAPSTVTSAAKASVSGNFRALAVLIEFSDQTSSVPGEDFDTLIFYDRTGTVKNYYKTVSYGNLDIVSLDLPSSIGWVTAPQTYAYYCNGERGIGDYPNNTQKLFEDVIDLIDGSIDFSDYDNDGNGYLDAFIMVHSGPGYEFTYDVNDIHSHKWGIWPPKYRDGVYLYEYNIQPEYWDSPGDITCGVFCHELGHVFGLPDLYDTDYTSRGVGVWSLMSSGSWLGPGYDGSRPAGPDAWSRIELGFASATNVTSNMTNANISSVESGGNIYRLWNAGATGSEYFLVENRQKTGYDSYLPGSGLLVWHVDETVSTDNDNEWYPGHTSSGHYLVALEQADGLFELEKLTNSGNSGDPFPGSTNKTSFSLVTTPNTDDYDGFNTNVGISNISASSATMTANFQVSLSLDVNDEDDLLIPNSPFMSQNYPNPFNPTTSIDINITEKTNLEVTIFNILGQHVRTLYDGQAGVGNTKITWDGTNDNGSTVPSGIYFYSAETDNESETRKMTLVK